MIFRFLIGFALIFLFFFGTECLGSEKVKLFTHVNDGKKYLYVIGELEDGHSLKSSNSFVAGKDTYLSIKLYKKGNVFFGRTAFSFDGEDFSRYRWFSESGETESELIYLRGYFFQSNPPPLDFNFNIKTEYEVQQGEYLYKIAKENATSVAELELANDLPDADIHPGQILKIGKLVFHGNDLKIAINRELCKMDVFFNDSLICSFPVSVGRDGMTPSGNFKIMRKIENPALYWEGEYISPLASINGLGKWWLELSNPQYGIHGTNKPWEIGKRISHGCIRMFNEDVAFIQEIVPIGTEVIIN